MNDILLRKAELKEAQLMQGLGAFLKSISWWSKIPLQLKRLIAAFLFHSFLRSSNLFVRARSPCAIPASRSFILESGRSIVKVEVWRVWNSRQQPFPQYDDRMDFAFVQFIECTRPPFQYPRKFELHGDTRGVELMRRLIDRHIS